MAWIALLMTGCSLHARALDLDGDGAWQTDCDDTTDLVFPGAEELCDGLDNNCDGVIDEGSECMSMSEADARIAITGEGTLGPFLATGLLDGDAFGDVLVQSQFGGSPGVCVVPGARLVDGIAGGAAAEATMAEVASCWVSEGAMLGLAVTSAAPFGEPASDVAWVLSSTDGLCAVDPYGTAVTLQEEAFGCTALAAWTSLGADPTSHVLSFGVADRASAALMALTTDGIGVARPTGLANDPGEFWAIQTTTPLLAIAGGDDVDGDGVGDIVALDASNLWVVSSDLNLSAPMELAAKLHRNDVYGASGLVLPGDVDGDGIADIGVVEAELVYLYSQGEIFGQIYGLSTMGPAGDFNGDGRADVAITRSFGPSVGVMLAPYSSSDSAALAQVQISTGSQSFGEATGATDVDHDGRTDLWILDSGTGGSTTTSDTGGAGDTGAWTGASGAGVLYLLDGFPISAE